MAAPVDEIARTLQQLQLPSLTRPNIGPSDPPTLELVQFDLKAYAYSSITYVRDLLDGLLVLWAAQNVAAVHLVIRGIYEWTMQASYVDQQNRSPIKSGDFAGCRSVMDRIQTGNGWVKRHGDKYWKPPFEEEIPESLRIKHLVKAYKAHQLEHRKEENVEDDYGYLSEHAHPNSFCFLDVTRRNGLVIEFVRPAPGTRNEGIVVATMLDWSLCIYNILGLAEESIVRKEFVAMLKRVVRKHEDS
jgi:hypothetical protein